LLLSQLLYWRERTNNPEGWVYKTHEEWEWETGLSRREQDTARRRLCNAGFIEERLAGMPARMFFRLKEEAILKAIGNVAQYGRKRQTTVGRKAPNSQAEIATQVEPEAPSKQGTIGQAITKNTSKKTKEYKESSDAPSAVVSPAFAKKKNDSVSIDSLTKNNGHQSISTIVWKAMLATCQIDKDLIPKPLRDKISDACALILKKYIDKPEEHIAEAITAFRTWWNHHDFRGKRQEAPTPDQVCSEWAKFEEYARRKGGIEMQRR
jgi:hypothetical protein